MYSSLITPVSPSKPFRHPLSDKKPKITKKLNAFGKKIDSIKNSTTKTLKNTAVKIKYFIKENYKYLFFALLSIYAFQFSPIRFLLGAVGSLIIQKVDYSPNEKILTAYSLAQNILGIVGIILEKTICPTCDPRYYFAPCLSGIAFAKVSYNLFQYYYSKSIQGNEK